MMKTILILWRQKIILRWRHRNCLKESSTLFFRFEQNMGLFQMVSQQIIQVQIQWQGWRHIMVHVPVDDLAWNINQSDGRIYSDNPDSPKEN